MNILLFGLLVFAFSSSASADCHDKIRCYENQVNDLLNKQIEVELQGQYTYLYLSYVFLRNDMYYPKASKYFREKSNEELQHAERFIEYQNQRGGTFKIGSVQRMTSGKCENIASLKQGFSCALQLEIFVTNKLTKLLGDVSDVKANSTCPDIDQKKRDLALAQPIIVTKGTDENMVTGHLSGVDCTGTFNFVKVEYVELAEMITHEFLGHQIEDTKELANFESTLAGFTKDEKLGSFLADKHLEL